ncbi:DUF493 family protein [Wenyingzhuangia marina]|uniref:DUF493 domain-containing protein n=1 Tax=Wenyingzhuangia marina TaxID=1195760 RepID=A0A1M5WRL0_9FLAO|nr:DUF493 family protein [Wenyingzhuangia marina]GGF80297.1 DUF493 domain-containing protein [Wenyingzhuangia marina]SHH90265.1 hypothetical protein SAMN05444281_2624 [Wenyingzhuangia marina]
MTEKEAFYKDLKEKLENNTKFPSDYLYKFIVPTTKNQEKEVEDVFKNTKAKITTRASKNGKFVSVSILLKVKNADEVIKNYYAVEKIEGIISL